MKLEIATSIIDWFDPNNIEHLKAYRELEHIGMWPKDFLPENILFTPTWNVGIMNKLADCYLRDKLNDDNTENPFILHGKELERTEQARKTR